MRQRIKSEDSDQIRRVGTSALDIIRLQLFEVLCEQKTYQV